MRTLGWHPNQPDRYTTMTVEELIEWLMKLPGDLPVFTTWEGQVMTIEPIHLTVEEFGIDNTKCLFIDAEH